jgi:hypothetical protein
MKRDPLDALLGAGGYDPGCDATFEQLHRYCEAVLRGADVTHEFPDVVIHLRNCPACREDTEGLLAALTTTEDEGA